MPKFISMEQDERGIPIKHTYEAKDGTRYSARYAAVAMAACDGRDGTATLRAAMAQMRAREAHAALLGKEMPAASTADTDQGEEAGQGAGFATSGPAPALLGREKS